VVRTSQSGLIPDTIGYFGLSGLIPDAADLSPAFRVSSRRKSANNGSSSLHRTSKSGLLFEATDEEEVGGDVTMTTTEVRADIEDVRERNGRQLPSFKDPLSASPLPLGLPRSIGKEC
jgi:hypothetical protein